MTTDTTAHPAEFHEAHRHLAGLTARAEKRALLWLAPRTPGRVTSDHLTLLGLLAMVGCGVLYALAGRHPWLLLLVNAGLVLNWLGDSLDGTLARFRGVERPRFGFYVDHLVDAFGALFVVGGLAFSTLMSPLVAAGFLIAYYLLSIETYLATYAIGRFKISWGPIGGTELRIGLAVVNALVFVQPRLVASGSEWLVFDVLGVGATAALGVVAVVAGVRGTRALARQEGWAPGGVSHPPSPRPRPATASGC